MKPNNIWKFSLIFSVLYFILILTNPIHVKANIHNNEHPINEVTDSFYIKHEPVFSKEKSDKINEYLNANMIYDVKNHIHDWWKIGEEPVLPLTGKPDGCYAIKREQFKCRSCGALQTFIFNQTLVKFYNHNSISWNYGHISGTSKHVYGSKCSMCGYQISKYTINCNGPPCIEPFSLKLYP